MHATNQVNWRNRAIANIQNRDPESLHLLHVGGMLQKDIRSMKAKLVECFDGIRASAQGSPPDEGLAITIDLFRF
ncbi:MAG: hypothetical protein EOP11_19235 [Proteobacteria bacterium]|nr:MAG: hypothetical protein EOP11_19235 [Pseudomonadota bacterium]